tara:strand:- start:1590 stop:1856 length:267 start_codon:yes stop_codon:yes gene_type:complete
MAYYITNAHGVTKTGDGLTFIYTFGVATIIAETTNDTMVITYLTPSSDYQASNTIAFSDINDDLGAINIEEYVDALAQGGYFKAQASG